MRRALPFLLSALATACGTPPVEPPAGSAPEARGVIEGTLVYSGPRPLCAVDPQGQPLRSYGQIVLTLFDYDDPPPPAGTARSPVNLMTLPAGALFPVSDCGLGTPIMRSAAFTWPDVEPGRTYQVRAFFDVDQDFVPFFSVLNQPTRGDVGGGAYLDPARGVYLPIAFGPAEAHPMGQVVSGVTLTLGAVVDTERPVFRLSPDAQPLEASRTFPMLPDPLEWEQALWEQTESRLDLVSAATPGYGDAFAAAGLELDPDPAGRAWYVRPVDLDGDGQPDPHPVLGGSGVEWTTPLWVLERGRTPAELQGGVPRVTLVGSTRPSRTALKDVFAPSIEMLLPPLAVVDLNPADPACRIAYLPPGNLASMYEGRPVECQELPTGRYAQAVMHGVAGAQVQSDVPSTESDTGYDLVGGAFSGQAWTLPNELGPPDQPYDPTSFAELDASVLVPEQGLDGRYVVHDATAENGVRHDCEAGVDPAAGGPRAIDYVPVPEACCASVRGLCDLPLCEAVELESGLAVREGVAGNDGRLACTPFLPPASCCP